MKKNLFSVFTCVCCLCAMSMTLSSCGESSNDDLIEEIATNPVDAVEAAEANTRMLHVLNDLNKKFYPNVNDDTEYDQQVVLASQLSSAGAAMGTSLSGGHGAILAAATMSSSAFSANSQLASASVQRWWKECAKAIACYEMDATCAVSAEAVSYDFSFVDVPERYRTIGKKLGETQNVVYVILSKGISKNWDINQMPDDLREAFGDKTLESNCVQGILESCKQGEVNITDLGIVSQVLYSYAEVLHKMKTQDDVERLVNDYAQEIERNVSLTVHQRLAIYNLLIMGAYSHEFWSTQGANYFTR